MNSKLNLLFPILIFLTFISFLFLNNYHSFNYGDGPRDIIIFTDLFYEYINSNLNLTFREFIDQRYTELIVYSGIDPEHPSISSYDTSFFFDRDQYRLLIFIPLIILKLIFIKLNTFEILFLNNLLYVFFTVLVIFNFGKKIHSNTFGSILSIFVIFNLYFIQLFWSAAENYIFYFTLLFFYNLLNLICFIKSRNIFSISKLIFSLLLLFLNGYPNTIISVIIFLVIFLLLNNWDKKYELLSKFFLTLLISLSIYIAISCSYSYFLGEKWSFQLNSVFFRLFQIKDLIFIGSSDVSSLSFDFNIFSKLYKLFSLIFFNQSIYISPHESGYLIGNSFFNSLESLLFITFILIVHKCIFINKQIKSLILTIILFLFLRIIFDQLLVIGKSNYDFFSLLIIFNAIVFDYLIRITGINRFNLKNFFYYIKLLSKNLIVNQRLIYLGSSIYEIKNILSLFLLMFPLIIILINSNLFKNKFLNNNFSSIGSLNGLNQVADLIKGNINKDHIFNFNDYFIHNFSRIIFLTDKIKLNYDNNYNFNSDNFIYINPNEITNYPLFNRFNPSKLFTIKGYYHPLYDFEIFDKKSLYKVYYGNQKIEKIKSKKTVNFINNNLNKILINGEFSFINFYCDDKRVIRYNNLFENFESTVIDLRNFSFVSYSNPLNQLNLNLENIRISDNNFINNSSYMIKNPDSKSRIYKKYVFENSVDYLNLYFPFYFFNREGSNSFINIKVDNNFFSNSAFKHKSFNDGKYGTFRFIDGNYSDRTIFHITKSNINDFILDITFKSKDSNDIIIPLNKSNLVKNIPQSLLEIRYRNKNLSNDIKDCNINEIKIDFKKINSENFIILKK